MSDYRDGLKAADKDAPYAAWIFFKWGLLALVVIGLLYFAGLSLGILKMDIERENVQHSRQYVETKISLLEKLHTDWLRLDAEIIELTIEEGNESIISAKTAQQKYIVVQMRTEVRRIPDSEVPATIRSFLSGRR